MSVEVGIYERIKQLRKSKGLTQKALATAINVSPQVISNWERGYTPYIDNDDILKLATALDTSFDYLLTGNDKDIAPPTPPEPQKPKDLIKFLDQSEVMFDGETYNLDEDDKKKLRDALEFAFWHAKQKNKRKK